MTQAVQPSMVQDFDAVWHNVHVATMQPRHQLEHMAATEAFGALQDAAVAVKDGQIAWVGPKQQLPAFDVLRTPLYDGQGQWLLPGFIDCHTHLLFAGNRAHEFEQRLQGVSYQDIAAQGGGIQSTVQATRAASAEDLFVLGKARLNTLLAQGVTTVEIKSGYGLDLENEQKLLQVAALLDQYHPIQIEKTFLGAHAVPAEYKHDPDQYFQRVVAQMLPALHQQGLVDAVDVFCEGIGFSVAQSRQLFQAATALGLPVKAHAEQLSALGGASLVAEFSGLSADHIEYLTDDDVTAMAAAGTVAVLLPGAFYFLRETKQPPIDKLRAAGVPMAIATDFNPGTSPLLNLPLMLNMACTLFRLTPEEAIAGVTCHAARALGLSDRGQIAVGMRADFALYQISRPAELCYQLAVDPLQQLVIGGKIITQLPHRR